MHISSSILALALGLAPVWAVPVKEVSELDLHPGAIPIERFLEYEQDLPILKPRLPKRGDEDQPDFTLKKDIVLNWDDGEEDVIKAELTANWKEQDEVKVVNMADFADAIEEVECQAPTMSLVFKKASTSRTPKRAGSGSTAATARTTSSCLPTTRLATRWVRLGPPSASPTSSTKTSSSWPSWRSKRSTTSRPSSPTASSLSTPSPTSTSPSRRRPETKTTPRTSLARTPNLRDPKKIAKRISGSINPTIPLGSNFNNKNIFTLFSSFNNFVKLECTTCGSRGKIKAKLYARITSWQAQESYVEFRAEDVQAFINLKLQGQANRSWQGHKVLFPITAKGIRIRGIATLRLAADFGVGYDAKLVGQGHVTWGATAMLTNPSVLRECFKGCSNIKTGQITTQQAQPTGAGSLTAILGAHAFITPKAEARIFSRGHEVGVALLAPKFQGTAAVQGNIAGGICANPSAILGVDVEVLLGLQCYAYGGDNYQPPS